MEKEEQKTRRNSTNTVKQRKHSLGLQTERGLYTAAEKDQVQRRRRRAQGLTIKIESPTTGEDSSAGIIESSGLQSSPGNIYLSGHSLSDVWYNELGSSDVVGRECGRGGDVRIPQ